jgi:hypothetical protein
MEVDSTMMINRGHDDGDRSDDYHRDGGGYTTAVMTGVMTGSTMTAMMTCVMTLIS